MPQLFWTYAGRMAFSIACSIVGALLVSKLGLLHREPPAQLERIVFDQSDLTRFDKIGQRVDAGHIALQELKAKQEKEEARRRAAEVAEKEAAADEERARSRAAAAPATKQDSRHSVATRRETASVETASPLAPPLVITPTVVADRPVPTREGLEGMFDRLTSGVTKIRDFVVNAVRIDKPAQLPFGSVSSSSDSVPVIDDLRSRLTLPAFDM